MSMAGFDRRKNPSDGVLDELFVSVLALEDGEGKCFLACSFDLLGVDSQLCAKVREAVCAVASVAEDRIWVSSTHTHSGPSGIYHGGATYDADYVNHICAQAAEATVVAVADLAEATPKFAKTHAVGVSSLRNMGREGADFPMPLYITRLEREGDCLEFCVFVCHPTVLDEKNTKYSKDIPGAAAAVLPENTSCLFWNGACADLSTRFTRRASDYAELQRIGGIMGEAIRDASYETLADFGMKITTAQQDIFLSRAASLDGEAKTELLNALRQKAAECTDSQALREYDSRIAVLERVSVAAEKNRRIRVAAVDFGPFALLSLPFEVDHKDGDELETILTELAQKPVYLLCYTGGYDGYLPSGKPLSVDSSYEDIASRYLPESREQVWECAKQCVLQAKQV